MVSVTSATVILEDCELLSSHLGLQLMLANGKSNLFPQTLRGWGAAVGRSSSRGTAQAAGAGEQFSRTPCLFHTNVISWWQE